MNYPEALIEKVAAVIPTPQASQYVRDWPEDEQRLYREGDWRSFTEREVALSWLRRRNAAVAALDAIGLREERGQHFVKVRHGWDEIVNQRRYVTDWEDS